MTGIFLYCIRVWLIYKVISNFLNSTENATRLIYNLARVEKA